MKRSTPLRRAPFNAPAKSSTRVSRPKCKNCRAPFTKWDMRVKWCSPECGAVLASKAVAKEAKSAAAQDKRQTRAQLEALKTIPQLKKEAQREFNRYIRARDRLADHNCISSNKPLSWGTAGITGSRVDAGHYRSTGAADHLRFNEDNCHAQSVSENRDKSGNAVAYRAGLIRRIGLDRVEALENDNRPIKWVREGLRSIRDEYRRKANELEKQIAMQS